MTSLSTLTYTDFNVLLISKCLWEDNTGTPSSVETYFLAERHILMDWVCDEFQLVHEGPRDSNLAEEILHHFTLCIAYQLKLHNQALNTKHSLSDFANYHFQKIVEQQSKPAYCDSKTSKWISEYHFPFAVLFWGMLVHTELDDEQESVMSSGYARSAKDLWDQSGASRVTSRGGNQSTKDVFFLFSQVLHQPSQYTPATDTTLPTSSLVVDLDAFQSNIYTQSALVKLGFLPSQQSTTSDTPIIDLVESNYVEASLRWKKVQLPHYKKRGSLPPNIGSYSRIGFFKLMGFPSAGDTRRISQVLYDVLGKNKSLNQFGAQNIILNKMKRLDYSRYSAGPATQEKYYSTTSLTNAADWWTTVQMVNEYYAFLSQQKTIDTTPRIHLAIAAGHPTLICNQPFHDHVVIHNGQEFSISTSQDRFTRHNLYGRWWKLDIRYLPLLLEGAFKNQSADIQKQIQTGQIWLEEIGANEYRSFKRNDYSFKQRFICFAHMDAAPPTSQWQCLTEYTPKGAEQWRLYRPYDTSVSITCAETALQVQTTPSDAEMETLKSINIEGLSNLSQLVGYRWLRHSFSTNLEEIPAHWLTEHRQQQHDIPINTSEFKEYFLSPEKNLSGVYEDLQTHIVYHFTETPVYLGYPIPNENLCPVDYDPNHQGTSVDSLLFSDSPTSPIPVEYSDNSEKLWFSNHHSEGISVGDIIVQELAQCDFWDASDVITQAQQFNSSLTLDSLQNFFDEIHAYVDNEPDFDHPLQHDDFCNKDIEIIQSNEEGFEEFESALMAFGQGSSGRKAKSGVRTFGLASTGNIVSVLDLLERRIRSLTITDPLKQTSQPNWLYAAHKSLYNMGLVSQFYTQNRYLHPNIDYIPPWPYESYVVEPYVALYQLKTANRNLEFRATLCGLASQQVKEHFKQLVEKCSGQPYQQSSISPITPCLHKATFSEQGSFDKFQELLAQDPNLSSRFLQLPPQWNLKYQIQDMATYSACELATSPDAHKAKIRVWHWERGGWSSKVNSQQHLNKYGSLIVNVENKNTPPMYHLIFLPDHPSVEGLDIQNIMMRPTQEGSTIDLSSVVTFQTRIQRDALFTGFMFSAAYQTHKGTHFLPCNRGIDFPLYISRFLSIVCDFNSGPIVSTQERSYPLIAYESNHIRSLLQLLITQS